MQTIGKYEVLEVIGHGGMGVVYRARDNAIGRHVALKVMGTALAQQGELRERFLREARAAGNLQHPNIVVIYDLGEDNGAPYIAMEFLDGQPLDKALAANSLTTRAKLETFALVCDGLHFAHQNGVIHRDVKPANVILPSKGGAKLVDFGIARTGDAGITRTGMMIGTVAYMAPEQLKAKPVDARSDVFSAGAMLYEMLAGKTPFEGESTAETMMRILQEEPQELKVEGTVSPQSLAEIVRRALEKEPANRYQTAREFGDAVRDYLLAQDLSGMRRTAVRPAPAEPVRERVRAEAAPLPRPVPVLVPDATRISAAPRMAPVAATQISSAAAAAAAPATRAETQSAVAEPEREGRWKRIAPVVILVLVLAAGLAAFLTLTHEKPGEKTALDVIATPPQQATPSSTTSTASTPTPAPTPSAPDIKTEPEHKEAVATPVEKPAAPKKPEAKTTASGVTYWDTKEGTGAMAVPGKQVTVAYSGHLLDGTPFDAANAGKPFTFDLGKGSLIKGFEEGILGMKVGGKRRLRVPPEAGYGATGAGAEIPPNATLIFDVGLQKVE